MRKHRFKLCAVFILIGLWSGLAFAQIKFSGVLKEDQERLLRQHPELQQSQPPLSVLDDAIRDLMLLDRYQSASVEQADDGSYQIVGMILKRIGEIKIGGNHAVSSDDITTALGIKLESRFDVAKLQEAGERVKELYGKRGYFNTIVGFDFQDISKTDVRLLVSVHERLPCLIQAVTINSDNPELNQRLQEIIKRSLGRPFAEDTVLDIESAINDYLRDRRFINAVLSQKDVTYNPSHTEAVLNYDLSDPYSYQLYITVKGTPSASGNPTLNNNPPYYTDRDIIRNLHLDNFTRGSRDPALDITNSIRSFYIRNGFPSVKVDMKQKVVMNPMEKRLLIDVTEGPRVLIDKIEISGHISRPAKYYSKFIENHSSDIVEKGYYVKDDLDNGFKNLITELNNQGFLRAKIQSNRIEYSKNKDSVRVLVTLDEGPLTQLSKVVFSGVNAFKVDTLLNEMSIRPNSPLHLNQLEDSIAKLKQFYYDHGFLEMRLLNENDSIVEYGDKGLSATVHFKIAEGPQIFVKSIYIEGNTFTKDYVIRRRLTIHTGDLLTPDLLEENRRILENTNLFSRVEIKTLEAGTNVSWRTLIVNVTERNPGLFKLSAGITNKNRLTARGRGGISYNNIAGTGRAASLFGIIQSNLVNTNLLEYEVDLGYKEPFLFSSRWLGRVDYTHSEYLLDIDNSQLLATDRVTFSTERDINSHIKFTWVGWGLDGEEQYTLPTSGPRELQTKVHVGYVGPIVDIDYSDNRFLPTKGSYARWEAIYADPNIGSSDKVNFYRTEATVSHYTRILGSPKWIWANSVRGGYEKNLDKLAGSGVPLSYAFFLGGYTTLRGYSGNGNDRVPNGTEFPIDTSTDVYVIPQDSDYYLLKSELRYPIHGPFGGVVFWEAGQVDIGGQTFYNPLRQTAGIGFRINTPVGPLSLDYGRKLNQQPGESPDAWHLFIGTF